MYCRMLGDFSVANDYVVIPFYRRVNTAHFWVYNNLGIAFILFNCTYTHTHIIICDVCALFVNPQIQYFFYSDCKKYYQL